MKRRSLVSNMERSIIGSSNDAFDDHKLLGADHSQTLEAQTPSLDVDSSNEMPPNRKGVHFEQHVYIGKYIA
jgi:hypothetical protein